MAIAPSARSSSRRSPARRACSTVSLRRRERVRVPTDSKPRPVDEPPGVREAALVSRAARVPAARALPLASSSAIEMRRVGLRAKVEQPELAAELHRTGAVDPGGSRLPRPASRARARGDPSRQAHVRARGGARDRTDRRPGTSSLARSSSFAAARSSPSESACRPPAAKSSAALAAISRCLLVPETELEPIPDGVGEVMTDDLDGRARILREVVGQLRVESCANLLRGFRVRGVPDEHVDEREGVVPSACTHRSDELAPRKREQSRADVVTRVRRAGAPPARDDGRRALGPPHVRSTSRSPSSS